MDNPHQHLRVWEGLPTDTLIAEQDRIARELEDLTSRAETIGMVILSRTE